MPDTLNRPPAFIPGEDDEDPIMDGLGFWAWGIYEGEWSGTTTWLADAPLPDEVHVSIRRPLPETFTGITRVREAVKAGRVQPVTLLAPIVRDSGHVVLPLAEADYDVDPNFVAHIARAIPGGTWMLTEPELAMRDSQDKKLEDAQPALVWVVDGEPRGLIAPVVHDA